MRPNNEYYKIAIETFEFGIILLVIYLIIYFFSKTKKKIIPLHTIVKKKPYEHINDGMKILQKGRTKTLLLISIIFLISSAVYFILYLTSIK